MYNWSVDEEHLKKYPEKYDIWRLEQLVNYGLNGEKINRKKLIKYWSKIHIDPARRRYLRFLLNGRLDLGIEKSDLPV